MYLLQLVQALRYESFAKEKILPKKDVTNSGDIAQSTNHNTTKDPRPTSNIQTIFNNENNVSNPNTTENESKNQNSDVNSAQQNIFEVSHSAILSHFG